MKQSQKTVGRVLLPNLCPIPVDFTTASRSERLSLLTLGGQKMVPIVFVFVLYAPYQKCLKKYSLKYILLE
jgi:hypothetical protein